MIFFAAAALLAVASLSCSSRQEGDERASQPAVAKTPATEKVSSEVRKSTADLASRCAQAAEELKKSLDGNFRIAIAPPFVVAGNMSAERLNRYIKGTIQSSANAMWNSFFDAKPDKVITVMLLSGDKSYRGWAKKLFDDTDVSHFGYYRPDIRTLVMNIDTGGGTLVHELTHALIVYDFPEVPTWFNEGLASLYEACRIGTDRITGVVNWRLPILKRAIASKTLRPLKETVTKRDFYGDLQDVNYAQARYFVMYMQEKEILQKFYEHFRRNYKNPPDDVKSIEHIFGKKIDQIEKEYLEWVGSLIYN